MKPDKEVSRRDLTTICIPWAKVLPIIICDFEGRAISAIHRAHDAFHVDLCAAKDICKKLRDGDFRLHRGRVEMKVHVSRISL